MTTRHYPPLAYCPTCDIAFPAAAIGIGGSPFAFSNVGTACPKGHPADVIDGTYSAVGDEIFAFLSTQDQKVQEAVLALTQRVLRNEITPQQAQSAAERLKPGLGSIFNPANWSDTIRAAVIVATIQAVSIGTTEVIKSRTQQSPPAMQQNVTIYPPPPHSINVPSATQEKDPRHKYKVLKRNQRHKNRVSMNRRPPKATR